MERAITKPAPSSLRHWEGVVRRTRCGRKTKNEEEQKHTGGGARLLHLETHTEISEPVGAGAEGPHHTELAPGMRNPTNSFVGGCQKDWDIWSANVSKNTVHLCLYKKPKRS